MAGMNLLIVQHWVPENEDSEFLAESPLSADVPSPGAGRGLSGSSLLALVWPTVVMEPVVL